MPVCTSPPEYQHDMMFRNITRCDYISFWWHAYFLSWNGLRMHAGQWFVFKLSLGGAEAQKEVTRDQMAQRCCRPISRLSWWVHAWVCFLELDIVEKAYMIISSKSTGWLSVIFMLVCIPCLLSCVCTRHGLFVSLCRSSSTPSNFFLE